jgi:hypothetical protein
MSKTLEKLSAAEIAPTEDSDRLDVLKLEYTSLLGLYTHTENTIFSIFNFYLTLLSAIIGAVVVLVQINTGNIMNALPSISGLLILTVLIGVIMQAPIINKNIDLSTLTLGINLLKYRLFRKWPDEMPNVFFIHNFWMKVHPIRMKNRANTTRIHDRFWWLFPMGTHQLFMSLINSLALAAIVAISAQWLLDGHVPPSIVIAGVFVFIISFEIQAVYARLKHRRGTENIATVDGSEIAWLRN